MYKSIHIHMGTVCRTKFKRELSLSLSLSLAYACISLQTSIYFFPAIDFKPCCCILSMDSHLMRHTMIIEVFRLDMSIYVRLGMWAAIDAASLLSLLCNPLYIALNIGCYARKCMRALVHLNFHLMSFKRIFFSSLFSFVQKKADGFLFPCYYCHVFFLLSSFFR